MEHSFEPQSPGFLIDPSLLSPPGGAPPQVHAPAAPIPPPLEEPALRARGFLGRLAIAEWLLKHRDFLLDQIDRGHEVEVILIDLLLVALLPTAFYGLVTGLATGSWVRAVTNPIKLPLVLVFTLVLCLPTLYIFSSYLGSRRTFLQTCALGFTGIAIVGVVLAAFAPITWFLTFTAPGAYALHVLVNVAVLSVGGFMGVAFLLHGTRRLYGRGTYLSRQLGFLWMWIGLYGLVGAEMGWLLRPFFSNTAEIVRQPGAGGQTVFSSLFGVLQHLIH